MNEANPRPGEAAARAAGINAPTPMTPDAEHPATTSTRSPLSKVTMRVSLKAPTPGAGPSALAPDPRRDIIAPPAAEVTAPEPVAAPAPMAPPLDISPILGGQFGSMNEVTSSPAPVLVPSTPAQPQASTPDVEPFATPAFQPTPQSLKRSTKVNRSGMLLNAACILLGIIAIVLFAFMLIE